MESQFEKLLQISDRTNYAQNAQTANFSYNNLTENADIKVVFERSREIIVVKGQNEVVTRRPVAFVQHTELEELSLPKPKVRDQLTIQTIIYDIVSVPEDGHNQTEMHLEKQ